MRERRGGERKRETLCFIFNLGFYLIYDIVRHSLMTRARTSVPSLEPCTYSTMWAVLYRMFFSREIYVVGDNELVIPWIPCRWDFRLHTCPPQGERTRRDRSLFYVDRLLRYRTSGPCCQDRYDREGFSYLAVREFSPWVIKR